MLHHQLLENTKRSPRDAKKIKNTVQKKESDGIRVKRQAVYDMTGSDPRQFAIGLHVRHNFVFVASCYRLGIQIVLIS